MELAIPLVALGGMYVISTQTSNKEGLSKKSNLTKENFNNMGIRTNLQEKTPESRFSNYLPNTNIAPQNYPIMNNKELIDTVQEYPNPNTATDKYFNQNVYQQKEREGVSISNNIHQVYSLTGNYLDTEQFKHNNMVPFYGAKIKGQIYNMNVNQTLLDNMSGTGSQMIEKVEQAPLFKPEKNINWAHGTPNWSDFFQSRVNPGMNNANVKPFQTENVGPGLGKGYTTEGSGGYNAGMED